DRYTASLKKQYILSLFTFLGSGLCGSISCGYVYFTTGSMLFLLEFLMTMSGALIQLVYCYIAKKLYDNRSHQYEHRLGKFESFGSLVGLFILYLNLMIVVVLSILKLFNPTPISQPTAFSIALIIWCLGYDCIMIANCLRQKKANNTKVLQGQLIQMSKNFINWLICGACAIVAFYWPTSVMAPYVEPVACLVIVLVIGYLSFPLIKENTFDLLDVSPDRRLSQKILKTLTASFDLYDGFETYRVRTMRNTIIIELYLSHDRELPVKEALKRNAAIRLAMESAIPDSVVQIMIQ
ncbi:MAG TPA: hypothetical protein DCY75_00825, partial [Clostridiales bacterium]|nr:hypothetical protein [Clostridiales bacterium]